MTIKLIQTGGTIDKQYNVSDGSLYFTESSLWKMLKQGRCALDINFHTLELLDSLDMSELYRDNVINICRECAEDMVLIAHGTDTIVESAQAVAMQIKDKTIVLFGAMIPFSINHSDALFNLGAAIMAVQLKQKGVYIVMNGQVFSADNVVKNRDKGEFESLPT